ncbi:MAG TPA: 4-hydroxy-tetrahydrodipicolinate reductase [Gemmatimonadaceae bacterium]|nr:4-hydroxy-tetrahydrodipicolinate reductase [Gemmatimonadaceae bacterium]
MTARKIAVIGDGKMGKTIADMAKGRGWTVTTILGENENADGRGITRESLQGADVAIEFTEPGSAVRNIKACIAAGCPVVVGTTGWYDHLAAVSADVTKSNGAMLWAANFSIGIQIMLDLARRAGSLVADLQGWDARIVETHHTEKKDAPSGTAIVIEQEASGAFGRKIPIESVRSGTVPGTHELIFDSKPEQLRIIHDVRDRSVFAGGALAAADWLVGKRGVFTMRDFLSGVGDS